MESTANFKEAGVCVSWYLETASRSTGVGTMDIPAVSTGKVLRASVLVHGGLVARLQQNMPHVFMGFTELFGSMRVNPVLQLCSWVEVSQD